MSADTRARVVYYDLGVNETILCARADREASGLCGYTNPGPGRGIRHCLRHRRVPTSPCEPRGIRRRPAVGTQPAAGGPGERDRVHRLARPGARPALRRLPRPLALV